MISTCPNRCGTRSRSSSVIRNRKASGCITIIADRMSNKTTGTAKGTGLASFVKKMFVSRDDDEEDEQ